MLKSSPSRTANYLRAAIQNSGKTLKEICDEIGLPRPNALSMMQSGRCNVPIDRIPALALACGVPADEFIRLAMSEYNPAVWEVLAKVVAQRPSADEREWLTIYEALSKSRPVTVDAGLWLDVFLHARSVIEKRGPVTDSSG